MPKHEMQRVIDEPNGRRVGSKAGSTVVVTSGGTGGGGGGASTFLDLADTLASYLGNGGKILVINSGETGIEAGTFDETILSLTDTPATFSGESLKLLRVNSGETAVEFSDPVTDTSAFTGLTDTPGSFSGQGTKVVSVNSGETALEFTTGATTTTLDFALDMTKRGVRGFYTMLSAAAMQGYGPLISPSELDDSEDWEACPDSSLDSPVFVQRTAAVSGRDAVLRWVDIANASFGINMSYKLAVKFGLTNSIADVRAFAVAGNFTPPTDADWSGNEHFGIYYDTDLSHTKWWFTMSDGATHSTHESTVSVAVDTTYIMVLNPVASTSVDLAIYDVDGTLLDSHQFSSDLPTETDSTLNVGIGSLAAAIKGVYHIGGAIEYGTFS